ncbi:hypothetical protein GPJ56_005271 [Histomonas meleagridis]|uniref:uncharacterized protein n=1 Tax=Histomonas meleagridis TaxID=135588 RepID=UPI003559F64D|nr:hypothetical protein GPJ56_005271 [Histomonas meleagridis]KAH0802121.1 hypothetical protein GO595_005202 [Histomonas meleagridis]
MDLIPYEKVGKKILKPLDTGNISLKANVSNGNFEISQNLDNGNISYSIHHEIYNKKFDIKSSKKGIEFKVNIEKLGGNASLSFQPFQKGNITYSLPGKFEIGKRIPSKFSLSGTFDFDPPIFKGKFGHSFSSEGAEFGLSLAYDPKAIKAAITTKYKKLQIGIESQNAKSTHTINYYPNKNLCFGIQSSMEKSDIKSFQIASLTKVDGLNIAFFSELIKPTIGAKGEISSKIFGCKPSAAISYIYSINDKKQKFSCGCTIGKGNTDLRLLMKDNVYQCAISTKAGSNINITFGYTLDKKVSSISAQFELK